MLLGMPLASVILIIIKLLVVSCTIAKVSNNQVTNNVSRSILEFNLSLRTVSREMNRFAYKHDIREQSYLDDDDDDTTL